MALLIAQGLWKSMFERLEISRSGEERDRWMCGRGVKCETLYITCYCSRKSIYHRRGTKKPSWQDELTSRCQPVPVFNPPSAAQQAFRAEKVERCRLCLVQQHGLPLAKADPATTAVGCLTWPPQRPVLSCRHTTILWRHQKVTWWQIDSSYPFNSRKDSNSPWLGLTFGLGMWLPFLPFYRIYDLWIWDSA